MIKILATFSLTILLYSSSIAQTFIDHWETAVYDSLTWKYFVGNSDPGATWMNKGFNDTSWPSGKGGIGYGDNDDRTIIEPTTSAFLRIKFNVTDKTKLLEAILHVDYDDGFVAYLNGAPIARSNMDVTNPTYYDLSIAPHEAMMYQGEDPEVFPIKEGVLSTLLVNGENVLAIQVHNSDASSDDLTLRAFLSFAIKDQSTFFGPTPSWFYVPQIFESSNLPIVIINTNSLTIAEGEPVEVQLNIIDNGQGNRNNITDIATDYRGLANIEILETPQRFPKKSYLFTTLKPDEEDSIKSLMGLPPGSEWILYAPYSDKSLMRDVLTYKLSREMGQYASRTRFCEVMINKDYKGVYVLKEKIKIDSNRVNIKPLGLKDTTAKKISGGYIIKADKENIDWESNPDPRLSGETNVKFQFYSPQKENLAESQKTYIKKYIQEFESVLSGKDYKDYIKGFRKYIDVPSFVDHILINELNKSIDAYLVDTYMYKNLDSLGGKLKMGPLGNYNQAFGNINYYEISQIDTGYLYNDMSRMFWFRRLMSDKDFKSQFQCRFLELRYSTLSSNSISQWIDSTANALSESQQRNFGRWPILGSYVWPNEFIGNTYRQEIGFLKQWIIERLAWMDEDLGNRCYPTASDDRVQEKVMVYPNPSNTDFNFVFKRPVIKSNFQIFSSTGEMIYSTYLSGTSFRWNGELKNGNKILPGIYLYKVIQNNQKVTSGKIIKYE